MGWSINPSSLASIDQNGVLSYQQHTSDITYEISYSDDDCTTSKSVTIYACTPCNCADLTVTGKTDISKDSGDNVTIGTFSKASCMSNPRASSSTSWLSNLSVSGNDIKATVEANSESSSRNGSVTVTVDKEGGGTCEKTMSITQQAGGGGGTKTLMVPYTISFTNVEKGTFVVKLKTQYDSKEITVEAGGGASTSGSSSGNARLIVPEEWDVATAIANVEVDESDMTLTIRHEVYNYDMTWNGSVLSAEISPTQCAVWNPWPDMCGDCKVCASVTIGRGARINIIATGGGGGRD